MHCANLGLRILKFEWQLIFGLQNLKIRNSVRLGTYVYTVYIQSTGRPKIDFDKPQVTRTGARVCSVYTLSGSKTHALKKTIYRYRGLGCYRVLDTRSRDFVWFDVPV